MVVPMRDDKMDDFVDANVNGVASSSLVFTGQPWKTPGAACAQTWRIAV